MRPIVAVSRVALLLLLALVPAAADTAKARLVGTHKDLACLALSRDGKTAATGGWDKTIKLWDVTAGKPLRSLENQHKGAVLALAFSPDGKHVLAGDENHTTVTWTLEGTVDGTESANYKASVEALAFSPDGKTVIVASGAKAHVWVQGTHSGWLVDPAVPDAQCAHRRPIHALAFSPDGTKVASAAGDETVKLWDAAKPSLVRTFEGHSGRVTGVAFSPDGKSLASACSDHSVRVWDLGATTDPVLLECEEQVNGLAFSPDGTKIAAATLKHVVLWTLADKTSKCLETEAANVRAVAYMPDGKALVTASSDGGVRVLSLE